MLPRRRERQSPDDRDTRTRGFELADVVEELFTPRSKHKHRTYRKPPTLPPPSPRSLPSNPAVPRQSSLDSTVASSTSVQPEESVSTVEEQPESVVQDSDSNQNSSQTQVEDDSYKISKEEEALTATNSPRPPQDEVLSSMQPASPVLAQSQREPDSLPNSGHSSPPLSPRISQRTAPLDFHASPLGLEYPPTFFPYYGPPPSSATYTHAMPYPSGYAYGPGHSMQSPYGPASHYAPAGSLSTPFGLHDVDPPLRHNGFTSSKGGNAADYPPSVPPGSTEHRASTAVEDDPTDLISQISAAIPSLSVLLSRYKDTHGQLGLREELIRQKETEQADNLKRKEDHIDALSKQLEDATKNHAAESNRLRLEIGNIEEKNKELEERLAEAVARTKDLEEAKTMLEAQRAVLENEKVESEKNLADEREQLQKRFEEWKVLENEAHTKEKETMRSLFQSQKRDLESSFETVRKELTDKLSIAQKDREEALKSERESRELWTAERQSLVKSWEEEREHINAGWEEKQKLLNDQHQKEKDDIQKLWIGLQAQAKEKAEEEKEALTKQINDLKTGWDKDKSDFERVVEGLKSVAQTLGTEKDRLQTTIESLGEITSLRSKGDDYFIDAFAQLSKQVLDFSATHSTSLSIPGPAEVLAQVPSGLPPFFVDTPPAHHIRAAYVSHIISTTLTSRIFTPFLFSLGHRYDKTDDLLATVSVQLREKSMREEAVWRQHTLHAIFTSSEAKQRVNAVAGSIVNEIVDSIKCFTDPSKEEAITVAVRRIVKLAAETWRYARLEREMITASMPPVDARNDEGEASDLWPPQTFDPTTYPVTATKALYEESPTKRKTLLRLFPVIKREPVHHYLRLSENEKNDQGCVYSPGLALYDDALPILARLQELRLASLAPPPESPCASNSPPPSPALLPPSSSPPADCEIAEPSPHCSESRSTTPVLSRAVVLSSGAAAGAPARTPTPLRQSASASQLSAVDEIDGQDPRSAKTTPGPSRLSTIAASSRSATVSNRSLDESSERSSPSGSVRRSVSGSTVRTVSGSWSGSSRGSLGKVSTHGSVGGRSVGSWHSAAIRGLYEGEPSEGERKRIE